MCELKGLDLKSQAGKEKVPVKSKARTSLDDSRSAWFFVHQGNGTIAQERKTQSGKTVSIFRDEKGQIDLGFLEENAQGTEITKMATEKIVSNGGAVKGKPKRPFDKAQENLHRISRETGQREVG